MQYFRAFYNFGGGTWTNFQASLNFIYSFVDKLASKGYINKFQSDEDRRAFHVHLSAKGKKLVKMHGEIHNKIVDMLQNNLDSKDLKNLVTILNKFVSKV